MSKSKSVGFLVCKTKVQFTKQWLQDLGFKFTGQGLIRINNAKRRTFTGGHGRSREVTGGHGSVPSSRPGSREARGPALGSALRACVLAWRDFGQSSPAIPLYLTSI